MLSASYEYDHCQNLITFKLIVNTQDKSRLKEQDNEIRFFSVIFLFSSSLALTQRLICFKYGLKFLDPGVFELGTWKMDAKYFFIYTRSVQIFTSCQKSLGLHQLLKLEVNFESIQICIMWLVRQATFTEKSEIKVLLTCPFYLWCTQQDNANKYLGK